MLPVCQIIFPSYLDTKTSLIQNNARFAFVHIFDSTPSHNNDYIALNLGWHRWSKDH